MSPEREQLVRETWRRFEPLAADHARYFYEKLFELDPEARELFERTNLDEQRHRLMATLGELVVEIDDPERFVPHLAMLGRRHMTYGVRDSDYDAAGVALLWTLENALGPSFTPEARAAWTEAYTAMSAIMRRVATRASGAFRLSELPPEE
jgi:hemoglobin-like flavoprotein